jgi:ABC-type transporter Mla maintaining outer membrane lipid asymmetry permease subunit MlaE
VGRSTTSAVVSSSVWIFVLTAFITYVWNRIFVSK